ncbi:hypothetical protein [Nitrosopumilus piranensis]|uniref:Uncharacterized protein n=1 Tax=Nitrosopumilus piranensis TaxID=1582439 RepID=A0A0C5BY33_9ARCH|nr:hypothetical protein [Nitrosopumilus piranensis]AJM91875.1 hypothetical protein NPIRD3C_0661 [Nitrosopumilus piranensis]
MSWRKIPMKFPGTCIVCNEKIEINEIGLWAKGLGVKHEKCAEVNELQCIVCGSPAGCPQCEFQENCDIPNVSQFCVCRKCGEQNDVFGLYQKATNKKFPIINS